MKLIGLRTFVKSTPQHHFLTAKIKYNHGKFVDISEIKRMYVH
jgi:hypothetical protein